MIYMAIAALILGIFSLLLLAVPKVSLVLALLAIIFGRIKLEDSKGKAGFILGIATLVLYIFIILVILISLALVTGRI